MSTATLSVSVPLRIVTRELAPGERPAPVVLALHGYAMDAGVMLELASRFVPERFLLASVEGPHSTFVPGSEAADGKRGFHWGVSPRNEENRALHRAAVEAAIAWALENGGDADRVSLVGFSQPCSFGYRTALAPPHGRPFRTVVGICGGLPGEWTDHEPPATEASLETHVLHIGTREDPFYPLDKVSVFERRLATRFASARHELYDGGHRVPSAAQGSLSAFLDERG